MEFKTVLINFLKGKHTLGQMLNLFKYLVGHKDTTVKWDPLFISAFPSTQCNLNCDMCLTHTTKFDNPWGQKTYKNMDFDLFKRILNKYENTIEINLVGNGEPLLNKDFFKMVDYASHVKKMYVHSGSNGILVGKYVKKIVNSPLKTFIISLNGHNNVEFNRMTGMPKKVFDEICNNIFKLVNFRNSKKGSELKIMVSIILDKKNYKEINHMIKFVESLGVDGVFFFQFLPLPVEGFKPEERCLFADDLDVVKTFNEVKNNLKSKIQISLPPLLPSSRDYKSCNVPFYNLAVDGEGNVGGCSCQLLNFLGNGTFDDDEDPWNNEYFQEFRKMFLESEKALLWPCKWCYNNTGNSPLLSNPGPLSLFLRKKFIKIKNRYNSE